MVTSLIRPQREGTANPSFAQERLEIYNRNLEKGLTNDFTLADIKGAAGAIYIAGNDTVGVRVTFRRQGS